MLEKEFEYYIKNQDELIKKFNNKFLVIIGQEIKGVFDTEDEAFKIAREKYELGSFLIQYCSPGNTSYTQTYHSRVSFAS